MDKRTIIFVISLSAALFVVNLFFSKQNEERRQQWAVEQQSKQLEQKQAIQADVSSRTAKSSDVGAVRLCADPACEKLVGWGVEIEGAVITLAHSDTVADKLYAVKEGDKPKLYSFIGGTKALGSPLIYAAPEFKKAPLGYLSDIGVFDLQLVPTIQGDQVHLAQSVDGDVRLPPGFAIETDAIAMIKADGRYLPVGIYRTKEGVLERLETLPSIAHYFVEQTLPVAIQAAKEEKYYVLENDFEQLVFSNRGAALVEINLPFLSATNSASVVRSIETDRDILEQSPKNARFPLHPYSTPGNGPQGPFEEHLEGKLGGFYPLIRRDLLSRQEEFSLPAKYYALNIVSQYPEVAELIYQVLSFDKDKIVFESVQPHRRILKTYTLVPGSEGAPYVLHLEIKIEGDSRGLWLTSGVPEVELFSGRPAPIVKYRQTRAGKAEVDKVNLPKDALTVSSFNPDWLCNSNGFLGLIIDPLSTIDAGYMVQYVPGLSAMSRFAVLGGNHGLEVANQYPGYVALLPLSSQGGTMNFRVFAGPFGEGVLKAVDQRFTDPKTGYTPDYIASISFHGFFSFISEPFAKFLFILMKFFYGLTHSWAAAIVLLTVALRVMMYPLNAWSMKSMRRMQQLSPEIAAIQQRHKKDPRKAQMEVMNLYRQAGANPFSGCFPMLIQLPFLIGMFDLLRSTFELRGAPFIPGWIDNLTAPDVAFRWQTALPLIGNEFHLLPVILGAIMFVQQKMTSTTPKDPSLMTDQQRQQKAMNTLMPVLFAVMFYNFASGLVIYWLSSTVLGIAQQWWTNRTIATQPAGTITVEKVGTKKNR